MPPRANPVRKKIAAKKLALKRPASGRNTSSKKPSPAVAKPKAPKEGVPEQLARECVRLRGELRRAGRVLHDDIASLLAVAGLRLQIANMDHPDAAERLAEIAEALEGVVIFVRQLSSEVEPTRVRRTGLKNALVDLTNHAAKNVAILVTLKYSVEAQVSQEAAEALYLATKAAVEDALAIQGLRKLTITASGLNKISVRVAHDQRGPASPTNLRTAQLLAQAAGISFEIAPGAGQTKKGTIVSIQYAK